MDENVKVTLKSSDVILQQPSILSYLQSVSSVHLKLKSGPFFMVIDLSELNLCIRVIGKSLTDIQYTFRGVKRGLKGLIGSERPYRLA